MAEENDNKNNDGNNGEAKKNSSSEEPVVVDMPEEKKAIDEEKILPESAPTRPGTIDMRLIMLPVALFAFLLSFPLLFESIWLLYIDQYDCEGIVRTLPRLQMGIAIGLIAMFFLSNGVVYLRSRRYYAAGLVAVVIPLVVMFTVGLSIKGSFNVETRQALGSHGWIRSQVQKVENWGRIKPCLYRAKICGNLAPSLTKLSPIQHGCCTPPAICDMEYVNITYWRRKNANAPDVKDCDAWTNEKTILCYDCESCKEGYARSLKDKWVKVGTFLVVVSTLLIIFHLLLFVTTLLANLSLGKKN